MRKNILKTTIAALTILFTVGMTIGSLPLMTNADDSGVYDVFVAIGADDDWSVCYAGEDLADSETVTNSAITSKSGKLVEGGTVSVSVTFTEPVNYVWYVTPVVLASDIEEADFTVELYVDGNPVELGNPDGKNWWYEQTGPFDEDTAVRLYGGYNEFASEACWVEEDVLTGASKIEYVITANNIRVVGEPEETSIEIVSDSEAGTDSVSEDGNIVSENIADESAPADNAGTEPGSGYYDGTLVAVGVVGTVAVASVATVLILKNKKEKNNKNKKKRK